MDALPFANSRARYQSRMIPIDDFRSFEEANVQKSYSNKRNEFEKTLDKYIFLQKIIENLRRNKGKEFFG